ncbi:magnesium transporter [Gymnopilus junonius]|uniref:Magnesium transporter n=1 Tax=Gymnopilus junonius TaxID=109634 RepID=A0A9P5NTY9_GYMJU|nr:magnesium transporter [Gymnopilus junonius]
MLGRVFLLLATIGIFHAAFSTYEHLSHLKALERPEGPIPQDIVFETIIALFLGILGACLNTPPFKEITWSSEMRKHKIDEMDSRLGFASYVNRGKQMISTSLSKAAQ